MSNNNAQTITLNGTAYTIDGISSRHKHNTTAYLIGPRGGAKVLHFWEDGTFILASMASTRDIIGTVEDPSKILSALSASRLTD